LAALEHDVKTIHGQLDDIRDVISQGHDVLFRANDSRANAVSAVLDRLDRIEERFTLTFRTGAGRVGIQTGPRARCVSAVPAWSPAPGGRSASRRPSNSSNDRRTLRPASRISKL